MNTNNILSADLLDLVFDDRNKEYGAYELRKTYEKRITKALLITGAITVLVFGSVLASNLNYKEPKTYRFTDGIVLTEAPKDEPPPLTPPVQKQPEPELVHTEAFLKPIIVDDKDVEKPPPSTDDLATAKIDDFTQQGTDYTGEIVKPSDIDGQTGVIEKNNVPEGPMRVVEIDAKFAGNWIKFLERNLNASVPVDNGAATGRYKVVVEFVVDIDGSVSDIKTLSSNGYGMEQEAVRVLKKAAKWEPAIQNGHQVKAYRKQVIVFEVQE